MKLPNVITRQLRKISFKSAASLHRHLRSLISAWNYTQSNPCTWSKRDAERKNHLSQKRGLKANHARHAMSCGQGYLYKLALVEAGKGHNTLAGIPA